jgi:hypothetical protein
MNRREFLTGLAGILGAGVAPAILPSGIIMPIKKLWTPELLGAVDVYPTRWGEVGTLSERALEKIIQEVWEKGAQPRWVIAGKAEFAVISGLNSRGLRWS